MQTLVQIMLIFEWIVSLIYSYTICMFIDWISKGKMGTDVGESSHPLITMFSFSFLNQPHC